MSIASEANCSGESVSSKRLKNNRKVKGLSTVQSRKGNLTAVSDIGARSYVLIEVGGGGGMDSGFNVHPSDADQMVDALILMLARARRIGRQ
jgi:hypothetical protein